MGEQLYADKFVFIREIMQNAIDTSCYRKFWEEARGVESFKVPSIEIYDWVDECANHYVRINDYGMGMSKKIIENYFLKVGESYYRSDDFNVEKLKIENKRRQKISFQPISQFGIGFLSCFLVCDSIEIYTCYRPIENTSSDIIRLSIKGVEDFYTMRLNNMATGMFNKPGYSERREIYGTSIVFRLNPELYDGNFHLEEIVKKYIFCPPVSVIVNGEVLDYMSDDFIHKKFLDTEEKIEITEEINAECIAGLKKWLHRKSLPKLFLRKIPCDITSLSLSPNLMGQGVFFYVTSEETIKITGDLFDRSYRISVRNSFLEVTLFETINREKVGKMEKKLNTLLDDLRTILKQLTKHNYLIRQHYLNKVLGHRQEIERLWENLDDLDNPDFSKKLDMICVFFSDMKSKMEKTFKKLGGKSGNKECQRYLTETISYTEKIINGVYKIKGLYVQSVNNTGYIRFNIDLGENKTLWDLQNLQKENNYSLSYNGIIIPNEPVGEGGYFRYTNNKYLQFGIMSSVIVLRNDLRPQLNLARNHAYKMEWDVYTNINITMKKFFHELNIYKITEPFGTLNSHLTYKEALEDRYIKNEWKEYKIIQTTEGLLSFYDVRDKLYKGSSIVLKLINRLYRKGKVNFFTVCSYTLLQLEFDILMKISDNRQCYDEKCSVKLLERENNRYNEAFYPPLFFAEFENEENNNILCFHNSPLNRRHPFSVWLLSVTPDLYHGHREFFNAIIKCFDELNITNCKEIAGRLNYILLQINRIAPELKIDKSLAINHSHRGLY